MRMSYVVGVQPRRAESVGGSFEFFFAIDLLGCRSVWDLMSYIVRKLRR
jgi:hypothetical protein